MAEVDSDTTSDDDRKALRSALVESRRSRDVPLQVVTGTAQVVRVAEITPRVLRVTLGGEDLRPLAAGWGPDHSIRLFFAAQGAVDVALPQTSANGDMEVPEGPPPISRAYTIRGFDTRAIEVDFDFVLHDGDGIAARWATTAEPGDPINFLAPSEPSWPIPEGFADYLLIGDETAIPAIATILESLPVGARATALVEVVDEADEQPFDSSADVSVSWLHRHAVPAGASDLLERATRDLAWPEGTVYVWIAGETKMVAIIRRYLREQRGLDRKSYRVTPFWRLGMSDSDRADLIARLSAAEMTSGGTSSFAENPLEEAILLLEEQDWREGS